MTASAALISPAGPDGVRVILRRSGPSYVVDVPELDARLTFRDVRADRELSADVAVNVADVHILRTTTSPGPRRAGIGWRGPSPTSPAMPRPTSGVGPCSPRRRPSSRGRNGSGVESTSAPRRAAWTARCSS